jgi:PAS domain S-box-containing protein
MNVAAPRPKLLHLALFAAIYLLGALLGHWLALMPGSGVTLWPPGGLYLAVLLSSEKRHWPWWVLAGLPAEAASDLWLFQFPLSTTLFIYSGNTLEALAGASLVRRWCGTRFQLSGLREMLSLILFGAVLSPVLGATVGAATLAALGRLEFTVVWPLWWVGDAVGVLMAAPLVLAVIQVRLRWRNIRSTVWIEAWALLAAFVAVSLLVFTGRIPFGYIVMLPMLWAALRFEIIGVAFTAFILSVMAARYTAAGLGPFADPAFGLGERQWLVQLFLTVAGISALVVAALTRQHRLALIALERAHGELEARVIERTAAARENEERLRLFFEHAPVAVAMFDCEMRYLAASRRWLDDYRLDGEVLGRSHYDVFPEIPERWREVHRRALAGEVVTADEDRFVRADGTAQWQRWEVRPWHGMDGAIGGVVLFTEDITERKRVEEALRQALAKAEAGDRLLSALMEHVPEGITIADAPNVNIRMVSRAGQELTGKPRKTLEGIPAEKHAAKWDIYRADGVTPASGEELPLTRATRKGETVRDEVWMLGNPDGRRIPILCNAGPIRDEAGNITGGVIAWRDITEIKRAEEALRASEQRFRAVFEHSGIGIAITDWEGHFLQCNPAYQALLGYTQEELGRIVFSDLVHPDDRAANLAEIHRLRREELPYFEIENRYVRKDGEPVCVRKFISLLHDSTGKPAHLVALVTDMTERRRMEDTLREADRRKDEFLAMLAHELRNPLAPIRNGLHVLRKSGGQDPATERVREMMERQVNHLVRLVDDLLEVSRITRGSIELKKERVDLMAIIGHAVEISQPLIQAGAHELSVSLPPAPLFLEADPVRLAQVLSNLLNNAAKYMEKGGRIRLAAKQQGQEAMVSVRDEGVGISAEMLPRVFDLFTQVDRSIDRSQGGLGIGLALVHRLVELHGGRVEALSEGPGRGSEFVIHLPLAAAAPAGAAMPEAPPPARPPPSRPPAADDRRDAAHGPACRSKP